MPSRYPLHLISLVLLFSVPALPHLLPVTLLRPPADAQLTLRTPDFDWSDSPQALFYEWQLGPDTTFTVDTQSDSSDSSRLILAQPLRMGIYYWRVRAHADSDSSLWSPAAKFTILFPAPTLLYPFQNGELTERFPAFDWSDVYSAVSYQLQLAGDTSFTILLQDISPIESSWLAGSELPLGVLYWRVRAISSVDSSAWSQVRQFEIMAPAPVLFKPVNFGIISDATPAFDWSEPLAAHSYDLEIDTVATFLNPLRQIVVDSSSYTPAADLAADTYYWRVRIHSARDTCLWSEIWRFTVIAPPQLLWLRINQGDSSTSAGIVRLNNSATNQPVYYKASEHADFINAFWLPYSEAPEFVLSPGEGLKIIYLKAKNGAGESEAIADSILRISTSSVLTNTAGPVPDDFLLQPPYPNPFNAAATISWRQARTNTVYLQVIDVLGRIQRQWQIGGGAGYHELLWDGRDENGILLPGGCYWIRARLSGGGEQLQQVLLLR